MGTRDENELPFRIQSKLKNLGMAFKRVIG